ncbi:hypothetical protein C2S52_002454 [Perilla frutescens var. hirtella]|nr:hypothetical protein C2S51_012970 [Perilla frutescens var. frutescens]KAH6791977.1 hypothetical protein C2S52_002454 [Perilla frutescens var. hirtella]
MAEVSIDSPVTPEKDELDEGSVNKRFARNQDSLTYGHSTNASHRRSSVGSNHAGASSLRNSVEKSESANSSQNVVPHYLRASTGSCHDLCKFGRAHSSETKARKPFLRKRMAKPLANELSPVQILVSGGKKDEVISGGKKEEVVSGGSKTEEVVSGGQKTEEVVSGGQKTEEVVSGGQKKEEVIDQEPRMVRKDHSANQKPSPDTKSSPEKPKTSKTSSEKKKATNPKRSTLTNNHSLNVPSSHNKSNLRKPNLSSYAKTHPSKQNDSSGKKTLLPKNKPSSAKKSPSADPPEIVKSVFFPYTVEDSVKQCSSIDNKISRTEKKTAHVAKQHSSPVKLKPVKVKSSFPSNDSDGTRGKGRSNSNSQTGRKVMSSKVSAKKILAPPSATLTSKLSLNKTAQVKSGKPGNLKSVPPLKDRSRIRRVNNKASNDGKVTEKTLHVIGMEPVNNVSESILGDNPISSPPSPSSAKSSAYGKSLSLSSNEVTSESEESAVEVDKLISENNDSLETGKEAPVKENHNKTMRKSRVVVPEDKHASAVKLKFRMGKVVDLQSDNNSPRRLRFRRARVLGAEDSKGDSRRKNMKKAGVNGDTADTGASSQKVVLKHQDVQGKKDAQGLLNNVIEQTASKLVESRKSKVKALVGAFETVISLQDTKPSTQVVS